jgi:hypothetical protein
MWSALSVIFPLEYLQKFFAQGHKFGDGEPISFGDSVTQFEHQPIGGGMQNKPHTKAARSKVAAAVGSGGFTKWEVTSVPAA